MRDASKWEYQKFKDSVYWEKHNLFFYFILFFPVR